MAYRPTQNNAVNRYKAKTYKIINLMLKKSEDADVLQKLDKVPSKKEYICDLIRKDLQNKKE